MKIIFARKIQSCHFQKLFEIDDVTRIERYLRQFLTFEVDNGEQVDLGVTWKFCVVMQHFFHSRLDLTCSVLSNHFSDFWIPTNICYALKSDHFCNITKSEAISTLSFLDGKRYTSFHFYNLRLIQSHLDSWAERFLLVILFMLKET